jgi:acetyl-CoA carboxylase carboxyl transferase subunit beta
MNEINENFIGLGDNLVDCLSCQENINDSDFYKKYGICPYCNFHYSIDFKKRLQVILDQNSFVEFNKNISVKKPKNLEIKSKYKKNVKSSRERTGLEEAVITGTGSIGGIKTVIILLDFGFLGGSMGIIVGEKISKAFSHAKKNSLPVFSIISSGGKRVQEGAFSLMQMIKTINATEELNDKKLPHVTLFTNPSGGQVYSSFANSADIKFAEPGAIMGMFTLSEMSKHSKNNKKINISSENFLTEGLVDKVVSRNNLKKEISILFELLISKNKIPKKIDLELPEISYSSKNKIKIDKSRPSGIDYIKSVLEDFVELGISNEKNISILGFGKIDSQSVITVSQNYQRLNKANKGKLNNQDINKIFKALELSNKFELPILFFVDNTGINSTFENEISGIGNNLSNSIKSLSNHEQPLITIITGETSTEGALPYFISDTVLMLENSIFYTSTDMEENNNNELDAINCLEIGIANKIIQEPPLGASKGPEDMSRLIKISIIKELSDLNYKSKRKLVRTRFKKFQEIDMGNNKLIENVSNEMKIWRNVLKAGYKALRN